MQWLLDELETAAKCSKLNESRNHCAEWKKPHQSENSEW